METVRVPDDLLGRIETYLTAAVRVGMDNKFEDGTPSANCMAYQQMAEQIRTLRDAPSSAASGETKAADTERGLYRKYDVRRLNDPSGKHVDCEYYVLDLMHDKYSADALEAYCRACTKEFPSLSIDLYQKAGKVRDEHDHHAPTNAAELNILRNQNANLERELSLALAARRKNAQGATQMIPLREAINEPCKGCGKRPIDFLIGAAPDSGQAGE